MSGLPIKIEDPPKINKIGMVARWQPVHLGHAAVLKALCRRAGHLEIGIGSANVSDYRNPFTLQEVTDMLNIALEGHDNYRLVPISDLHNGPLWREMVMDLFGDLDVFVSENPYVHSLFDSIYPLAHPVTFVPPAEQVAVSGTLVRRRMARGENWAYLVPPKVAAYIKEHQLDERFRREYGLQTLALETMIEERSTN